MPSRLALTAVAAALVAASPPPASAQQAFEGQIGRFYEDAGWTLYRAGIRRPLGGPIGLALHG